MTHHIAKETIEAVEMLLIQNDHRGMSRIRQALNPGYLGRAAELLRTKRGTAYIATGFPVAGSFETDGPAGAMALYRLCERNHLRPTILSDPAVTHCLSPTYRTMELATGTTEHIRQSVQDLYQSTPPALLISIERPGAAMDGKYYNMSGTDITPECTPAEPYFELAACPTIAIGDGGNELGMGKAAEALSALDIHPAMSICDELLVADVSNWAAYAICALAYAQSGAIPDLGADIRNDLAFLVESGAVDGVTGKPTATEDGFAEGAGNVLIDHIITLLYRECTL